MSDVRNGCCNKRVPVVLTAELGRELSWVISSLSRDTAPPKSTAEELIKDSAATGKAALLL